MQLTLYWMNGLWYFDDDALQIRREPFVGLATATMIVDALEQAIQECE